MKLIGIFSTICIVLLMAIETVVREQPFPSAGWKLVWADEFDKDGRPDPGNWGYETGFVRNGEFQWYQPDNAWCEKGLLIIEGRREQKKTPNYDPTRSGLWPAFWTLGIEGEWPSNGEIDIMEYYRGMLLANVAWGTERRWTAQWDTFKKPIIEFNDPDWSRKFHIWRMDWNENEIRLYVDDILLNTTDLTNTFNKNTERKNPFHQPHYLILNLAIGGSNGGDPAGTDFPARFEVDYVRVYQKSDKKM